MSTRRYMICVFNNSIHDNSIMNLPLKEDSQSKQTQELLLSLNLVPFVTMHVYLRYFGELRVLFSPDTDSDSRLAPSQRYEPTFEKKILSQNNHNNDCFR
jgi:hypothetical protein